MDWWFVNIKEGDEVAWNRSPPFYGLLTVVSTSMGYLWLPSRMRRA